MKTLFKFVVEKEEIVDDVTVSKNDAGDEVRTVKKVSKAVPHTFALRRPNRSITDEAELYYGIKLAEGIRAGLLTRTLLEKRYLNDGGTLSEPEKQVISDLYTKFLDTKLKTDKIAAKEEKNRSSEEVEELKALEKSQKEIRESIRQFEFDQFTLYENTAESKARDKTILWWVLFLSYKQNADGALEPLFGSGTFQERLAKLEELEESEDPFINKALKRLMYLITFWYVGRVANEADFQAALDNYQE